MSYHLKRQLPRILTFVDVETSGSTAAHDRIIEVGILRVENGKLVDTYQTLVNPQQSVSPFISTMTGIAPRDLENAPSFCDIKDKIYGFFENAVLVAHNARFDHGFLKYEFARQNIKLKVPYMCTVRMFRALHPGRRRYNLDSLIEAYQLTCQRRHRAFDDAKVLWEFYRRASGQFSREHLLQAVHVAQNKPILPPHISQETIDELPESAGVYIFWGEEEIPLYIGKSKNIKTRVLSHFRSDLQNSKDAKIRDQLRTIETRETAGELGALLLESYLVKTLQPHYNRQLRRMHKLLVAKQSISSGVIRIRSELITHIDPLDFEDVLGVYKNDNQMKRSLDEIGKTHHLCQIMLGLQKGTGPCFWHHLGVCNGICVGRETPAAYNIRVITAFGKSRIKRWPFPGPIAVREASQDTTDVFIINNWCLLGHLSADTDDAHNIRTHEEPFDLDTYKILIRHIMNNNRDLHISHVSTHDVSHLSIS